MLTQSAVRETHIAGLPVFLFFWCSPRFPLAIIPELGNFIYEDQEEKKKYTMKVTVTKYGDDQQNYFEKKELLGPGVHVWAIRVE